MKVLISGAGIGGLAAARALAADGHQVTVFEQAGQLRHGGAAVTLWSNGTGILHELGVDLGNAGAPIDVLETRDHRGKLLVSIDVAQSAAHYGHPHICLPRNRLLGLLAEGLPSGTIVYGRPAAAVAAPGPAAVAAPGPAGVAAPGPAAGAAPGPAAGAGLPAAASGPAGASAATLTFADGSSAEGDLVVAADGRGSALRDQLWGGDPGQLTGWATWQGISPLPSAIASSRRSVLFVGRPGTCGLMPAGDGLLQWWFDLRWPPGSTRADKPVAMLRERFGDWAPPVRQVLDAVTDEETGFFPHYRHRVPKTWGRGPVTVIGDAAHSMPPTRAQGANQALEDAWALAAALRGAGSGETGSGETGTAQALRTFEGRRAKRVSVVSRQAGSEDYNRYGALLSRLVPGSLATRYYTRWLGQISNFLGEG
jgi:FAD-dependent urate hydroxylase